MKTLCRVLIPYSISMKFNIVCDFFFLFCRSDFVCRVKYNNSLPDIPFDAKFITYPFEESRSVCVLYRKAWKVNCIAVIITKWNVLLKSKIIVKKIKTQFANTLYIPLVEEWKKWKMLSLTSLGHRALECTSHMISVLFYLRWQTTLVKYIQDFEILVLCKKWGSWLAKERDCTILWTFLMTIVCWLLWQFSSTHAIAWCAHTPSSPK